MKQEMQLLRPQVMVECGKLADSVRILKSKINQDSKWR